LVIKSELGLSLSIIRKIWKRSYFFTKSTNIEEGNSSASSGDRQGDTFDINWLNGKIRELVKFAYKQDAPGIKSKRKEMIPEYEPFDPNGHSSSQDQ
jgi:hypothetical protein